MPTEEKLQPGSQSPRSPAPGQVPGQSLRSPESAPRPAAIIFVITRGDSIGGGQIHVRDLSIAAQRKGYRAAVALGSPGALTDALDAAGVKWYRLERLVRSINLRSDAAAVNELREVLKDFKPDLISCHTAKAGMIGRMAGFLEGIPSVFTAHGWQFADGIGRGQKAAVLAVEYLCARLCRKIITVSQYDYDLALRYRVAGEKKLRLVHNGMPDRPCPPRPRPSRPTDAGTALAADAGTAAQAVRLIMVARFQEQKDHGTLFRALSGLKDLPWTIDLVGDGPLMDAGRALAAELGIAERIRFMGQRMDVPELMDDADLFLLISHWEGFPRSILEAMRAGLPVIASDVGGCKESVQEGVTGCLVPQGGEAILAQRIRALVANEAERVRMGVAGRKLFEERFEFSAMYKATEAVWFECMD
jgi:glycosyltransferase involved in cell wall biosynthesis